jgi:lipoprotein-anchoring transpeptidase ErfK/SrfK
VVAMSGGMPHLILILTLVIAGMLTGASPVQSASVELKKSTRVYAAPSKDAPEIGKIASHTRVRVVETRRGRDCRYRWRLIEPRGWICAKTKPTKREITVKTLPLLKEGALPLGRYGRVSKKSDVLIYKNSRAVQANEGEAPEKSMSVLRKKIRRIDGKRFWQTTNGRLIESRFIRRYRPSDYKGVTLDAHTNKLTLPIAWARPREKGEQVLVYAAPSLDAEIVSDLPPKTQVPYLGESKNRTFVRIGEGQWILRNESRKASLTSPPAEVNADELWIDVDLQEQVLVAYVGKSPVYTTMISTGTRKHRTPPGKYRIQRKVAQKTMASGESSEEQYSVGGVPWVMYVHGTYALHGAYWHDRVGAPRSHGCVNLAPKDAQHIYGLVQPQVPAGWISASATEENPGTLVHIRSSRKPNASTRIRYELAMAK